MEIHAGYCVGESAGRLTSKGTITPEKPGKGYARRGGEWGLSGAYVKTTSSPDHTTVRKEHTILAAGKTANINPAEYLADIFQKLPCSRTSEVDDLIPGRWSPQKKHH